MPQAPPIATATRPGGRSGIRRCRRFTGRSARVAGGWIRLPELRPVDALLAAAITDGWLPPTFSRIQEPVVVPTVDLTIHFRAELPHPGLADDAFVLASFRTTVAADGFLEEDGEIWAPTERCSPNPASSQRSSRCRVASVVTGARNGHRSIRSDI